ncbi:hypothetical protein [Kribbella lupini]|uniref:Nucleotidyltransferase AbiEii toxin of type IV toxin-antitoxin system n=1 Tax=Kribbella lupini TaxID=291602 RepID=A0ABP4MCE2_9ACTN
MNRLQAEAHQLFAQLGLETVFPDYGPPQLIGSARSGLIVLRDLDVMFDAPTATLSGVLAGLGAVAERCDLLSADVRDERGDRRPTPRLTDERFYAVLGVGEWKVDLTFWLHVIERPHVADALRLQRITEEERQAILRLKRTCPGYPELIGGTDVYDAVLRHGVRA